MMYELYLKYRDKYPNTIIMMKSGTFYIVMNEDVFLMNKIFGYEVKVTKEYLKCGFPMVSMTKVLEKLKIGKINYIVIENNEISEENKNKNNQYKIDFGIERYRVLNNRINMINHILNNRIFNIDIDILLSKIEGVL